jgi:flotillin
MDQAQILGIAVGVGLVAVLGLIGFIKANMVICQPNEIVILSGRQRKQPDGTKVGYRVLRGGRGFKMPFIESVARLSLTTQPVEVHLPKALCEGMIPVSIEGRANVKLAGRREDGMDFAVERFLGKGPEAVTRTAQQVIEGALRGVIASVSPEEANAKRLELADQVAERARQELGRLGIVLDFVQIQSISDDQGYLEAIGRRRNATVRRDAQIAEAEAEAEEIVLSSALKSRATSRARKKSWSWKTSASSCRRSGRKRRPSFRQGHGARRLSWKPAARLPPSSKTARRPPKRWSSCVSSGSRANHVTCS